MLARKSVALLAPLLIFSISRNCAAGDAATSSVQITKNDAATFTRPNKATLQTWYMKSVGVGSAEIQAWYITGGKAILCDQQLYWWENVQQSTWRVMLLQQNTPNITVPALLGLTTVFETGKPEMTGTGVSADEIPSKRVLPTSTAVFRFTDTNAISLLPNQTSVIYLACSKIPAASGSFRRLLQQDPKLMNDLIKQSRQQGQAFAVVTISWKPAKGLPQP